MYDDYVSTRTCEEYYSNYQYDYDFHETWYEIECAFCEELGIEPEVYED